MTISTSPVIVDSCNSTSITRDDYRTQGNRDFKQSVSQAGAFHSFGKQYLSEFITFHEKIGNM
jgi:hypothetical protein